MQAGSVHMGGQPPVFRVQVQNVPAYLSSEEFRAQFMSCEGVVNANMAKDENGYDSYYIDFDRQDHADKCIVMYDSWKGWGPKGLAFKRIGTVLTDLKRGAPGVFAIILRLESNGFLERCVNPFREFEANPRPHLAFKITS